MRYEQCEQCAALYTPVAGPRFEGTQLILDVTLRTSSVAKAQIRETPNVAEAHSVADAGQHEVQVIGPVATLLVLVHLGTALGVHLGLDWAVIFVDQSHMVLEV